MGAVVLLAATSHAQEVPATPAAPVAPAAPAAAQQAVADAPINPESIAMLEKALSGCTLVGQFTVDGRGGVRPAPERYELSSVKHLTGETWLITARIKYGDHDVTVPLPIPIRWAGDDTPVITLDEFSVPGMGTYSARVMIYKDRYMGYWSAKDHGGYLFGVVEPPNDKAQEAGGDGDAAPEAGATK